MFPSNGGLLLYDVSKVCGEVSCVDRWIGPMLESKEDKTEGVGRGFPFLTVFFDCPKKLVVDRLVLGMRAL